MRMEIKPNMNKIRKLKVGMIFQTMDELCEFVGLPRVNGKTTGYQLLKREFALLKVGVEIERKGYKIVIVSINLKIID